MNIEVDSHTHTIAGGHAYSTLAENVQAAGENNIRLLAFTEHGPQMPGGPHPWFFNNLRVLPRFMNGIGILRGVEANILDTTGSLDVSSEIVSQLDLILGSLHEPLFAPSVKAHHTKAVIEAMASGNIDVFAHGGNPSFPIDCDEVAKAAKEFRVLIEINNSSFTTSRKGSEPNCTTLARAVVDNDGFLVFGSDAHIASRVGQFSQCLDFAKTNDIPKKNIINYDAVAFLHFLKDRGRSSVIDFLDVLQP